MGRDVENELLSLGMDKSKVARFLVKFPDTEYVSYLIDGATDMARRFPLDILNAILCYDPGRLDPYKQWCKAQGKMESYQKNQAEALQKKVEQKEVELKEVELFARLSFQFNKLSDSERQKYVNKAKLHSPVAPQFLVEQQALQFYIKENRCE